MAVITGTTGNDTLAGTTSVDTISGLDGNDGLTGNLGNDTLFGGNGTDTLTGGAGADSLDGGTGTDTADYSASTAGVNVSVNGASNTGGDAAGDVLTGMENLTGSGQNDTLTGDTGNNVLTGGLGNDGLSGGTGNDSLFGGDGTDTLTGGVGADSLDGGVGTDTADYSASTAGVNVTVNGASNTGGDAAGDVLTAMENLTGSGQNDTLTGDTGNNVLTGGLGNDALSGGNGNDSLYGGDGSDTLVGGAGNDLNDGGTGIDTYDASSSASAVSVNLGLGTATGTSIGTDTLSGIENVIGTNLGDTLIGGTTDNVLAGGAGADVITGGTGTDTADYSASAEAVVVNLADGTIETGGDAEGDVVTGVENIIGSGFDDTLTGGVENNLFLGGAGADRISGGGGVDTVSYSTSAAAVSVDLTSTSGYGGDAEGDYLDGMRSVIGSGFDDILTGNELANQLYGGAGNDHIYGGTGADTMAGGLGDDLYRVDNIADLVVENAGEGIDTVLSAFDWTLSNGIENLTLTGSSSIDGTGNALDNVIIGTTYPTQFLTTSGSNLLQGLAGNDTLYGGGGNDTLDGGTGNDSMVGGIGNDIYIVDSLSDAVVELSGEGVDRVVSSVSYVLTAEWVENLVLSGVGTISGTGNQRGNTVTGNDAANLLSGLEGDDTLIGNGGNDTLDGGTGSDSMVGGLGDDTYYVDAEDDKAAESATGGTDRVLSSVTHTLDTNVENLTLTGNAAINGAGNSVRNVITGNDANNILSGGAENDTLYGGGGNDTIDGGTGKDLMVGGTGDDTYTIDSTSDVVTELADGGIDTIVTALGWNLSNTFENLTLTGIVAVNGTGNALNNILTGNVAANVLNGGAGDDTMIGGAGNDTYYVDSLDDMVVELADEGTDRVVSSVAYVLSDTAVENLTLSGLLAIDGTGNLGNNALTGNEAANLLSGLEGNDTLVGNGGNDTLDGGAGIDSMTGGMGDDLYYVDAVGDRAIETSTGGFDRVISSATHALDVYVENLTLTGNAAINGAGNSVRNVITGNDADNLLSGGGDNDKLYGGIGNDSLDGGTGSDLMVGGAGNDTYTVDLITDVVTELADGGIDTILTALGWNLADTFENLTLTGTSKVNGTGNALNNIVTGNTVSNVLYGEAGNDTLSGGGGNDTLNGGEGDDSMAGGVGSDTYHVDSLNDVVVELAGEGIDRVVSAVGYSFASSADLENLTLTGVAAINGTGNIQANILTGNDAVNLLSGMEGNDTLNGNGGNDTLDGGAGIDSMTGGLGDDLYYVDAVGDRAIETALGGTDSVVASASHTLDVYVENLTLIGDAAINGAGNTLRNLITGNDAANILSGGAENDTLYGGGGDDTIEGGSGKDVMVGGAGNDTYTIDSTGDVVTELADGGIDTIKTALGFSLAGNFENLTLTGKGVVNGSGNSLDNILSGNSAANILSGGDGNDTIGGGGGNDTLFGGDGADHFVFISGGVQGTDTIKDFNALAGGGAEGDVIELRGMLVGTFAYMGNGAFSGSSDNSEARVVGSQVQIDADGNGIADFAINLTGLTNAEQLTADQFQWF